MAMLMSRAKGVSVDPEALSLLATECLKEAGSANTDNYLYEVRNQWLAQRKKYTGQTKPFQAGAVQVPGPVEQDEDGAEGGNNSFINGRLWRHLVFWYGIHPTHELDRILVEQEFETKLNKIQCSLGMMTPMSDLVQRKQKKFCREEVAGYIECQLRQIMGVTEHRETRLWLKKAGDQSACYQLVTDRYLDFYTVCKAFGIESTEDLVLMLNLEVSSPQGEWPTGYMTEVKGKLSFFADVTIGGLILWDVQNQVIGENKELNFTCKKQLATQLVHYEKFLTLTELEYKKLVNQLKNVQAMAAQQEKLKEELANKENSLIHQTQELSLQRRTLNEEQETHKNERNLLESINAISDSMVILNVGGKYFTTSLQTLRKYESSILAVMFSGRFPLKKSPDGSYFIDRDGTYFHYILDYLRNDVFDERGMLKQPGGETIVRHIIFESDYYNLTQLSDRLHDVLGNSDFVDIFGNMETDLFYHGDY